MPLTNWFCSLHRTVPLDHWSSGECSIYSSRVIDTILAKEQGDSNHQGYTLTPTTVLACPRQILIQRFLPYAASPDQFLTMSYGTWMHSAIDYLKVPIKGELFGHEFVGEIDAVDGGIIEEDKTTSLKNMRRIIKYGPEKERPDNIAQLSMYKIIYEQMFNNIDEIALNYYCAGGTDGTPPYMRFVVKPMNEDQILRLKPLGGDQTFEENLGQLVRSFKAIKDGADPIDVIRSLPLAGNTMLHGYKCTAKFCIQFDLCLNKIQGLPVW